MHVWLSRLFVFMSRLQCGQCAVSHWAVTKSPRMSAMPRASLRALLLQRCCVGGTAPKGYPLGGSEPSNGCHDAVYCTWAEKYVIPCFCSLSVNLGCMTACDPRVGKIPNQQLLAVVHRHAA